jgi:hypothetical protein
MNKFYFGATILILQGFLFPYILFLKKKISYISNKRKMDLTEGVNDIKDFKKIYLTIRNNKSLNNFERRIFLSYLILILISLMLYLIFVYIFITW